jgi:NAD(P)-dependent dehydrogenase (short-subunit alcohol dehydrogenase family)
VNPKETNDFDLTGKICIVTGAGSGIGRGMAEGLARHGATVVLAGRTRAKLDETAAIIGEQAFVQPADVSNQADVIALRDAVLARYGKIDVLVNNAGVNPILKTIERTSLEEWTDIINVNLTGLFLCCKHIGGAIGEGGSVINVSSIAGHGGLLRSTPYCASKGGVELFTKALALDWAPRKVRVNALAPGWVDTDLTHGFLGHDVHGKRSLERTPLGRFGTPRDMAGGVILLASDASAFITGHSLVIDGGWSAE